MEKQKKVNAAILFFVSLLFFTSNLAAQNPNFYIYLCFGQSNMQGSAPIQSQDKSVNERFKVFQALNCSNLNREKATWYKAVPPTCQCYSLLSPADYFGRTMVANLPDSITIGIINVSVAGCDIRLFDKDIYQNYTSKFTDSWWTSLIAGYNGNPYQYLIDVAKLAQKDGVIKGILLHQGESNTGDVKWVSYVKKIYNDMLTDLALNADSVPILAGELLAVTGNCCSSMNPIIKRLPYTIPTAHVISSSGCEGQDNAHFNTTGIRKLGKRYAVQMLSLIGYESNYAEAECGNIGANLSVLEDSIASNSAYVTSLNKISTPPSDDLNILKMNVSVKADTTYYLFGRLKNSDANQNSFWLKIDDGEFELFDNMTTNEWEWLELKKLILTKGEHNVSFSFANGSIMLDKITVKNSHIKPIDVGEEAGKLCEPVTNTGFIKANMEGYSLEQSYPNPINNNKLNIIFKIPNTCFVSLKITNSLGIEIDELAGKTYYSGEHIIEYNSKKLMPGIYLYRIKADKFSATRKIIVTSEQF
jgi:hypothetical protein